ncbi:MAG: GGDEF domain-containing protein [Ilumatobacteraceae bacterium]
MEATQPRFGGDPSPLTDRAVHDPMASLTSAERFLLKVIRERGLRSFVVAVVVASVLMSQVVTFVLMVLVDSSAEEIAIGTGIALVVPIVVASTAASSLGRLLTALGTATAELEQLSRTDSLTGVLNRRAFGEQAAELWATSADHVVVVAMVDIDQFKATNDRWGHAAGDRVLQVLASSLASAIDGPGVVGRLGGDEFAVLALAELQTAQHLRERLAAACDLDTTITALTASIGIVVAPVAESVEQALAQADHALYREKRTLPR